ncbi:MAG TPA: ABC transporter permease [Vicinamibacterales bacterium]|nr:ABC transporter permease [Vicinamibacterales bacterium]
MSLWRQATRGLGALLHRRAADREVADEVQHFLDEAAAEHVARGVSPEEARRLVRLEAGPAAAVGEQVRTSTWEYGLETAVADLRYGARRLRAAPGFTLVSVVTLALGIGASTAIFSAVNPILFEPLPYPDASRIAMISDFGAQGTRLDVTFGTYREIAARSRSFDALAVMRPWQPTLVERDQTERLDGQRVSAAYFQALGVAPRLGRDFQDADDRLHGPAVVIISHRLWRQRFGSDPAAIGRPIRLDGIEYTVIGVMPAGFENVLAPAADVWTPLQYDRTLPYDGREWGHHLKMVGRLRTGVAVNGARREMAEIAARRLPAFPRPPWAEFSRGLLVTTLQADITQAVRPALLAVLGAVLLVLAIGCVNVTNLLLARGVRRRGEFAVRVALGAGRSRLLRQLLAETLLLAGAGGALGLGVAAFGVRALVALSPAGLPRVEAIHVDRTVFLFAVLLTTVIGVLVGMLPALQALRSNLQDGLQQTGRRSTGGHRLARGALVVGEVALACVLLVGAGLLFRSLQRLFAVPTGFDASRVLTMQVVGSDARVADAAARLAFFDQALQKVEAVPGVETAAFTSQLPLSGDLDGYGAHFEIDRDASTRDGVLRYAVTADYFRVLRIPLVRGRLLSAHDDAGARRVALINASLAATKFRGTDPIGQRFVFGDDPTWYTIVGVVGDVRQTSLAVAGQDAIYLTPAQGASNNRTMSLVARTRADPRPLIPMVRAAIWSVDREEAIVRSATMADLVERTEADRRFALTLFEAFALSALLLAALGIYGVLSGSVTERTRELGVRAALGASRTSILRLVVRQGMMLTGAGVVAGIAGAAAASQALVSMLFGITALDAVTYAAVVAVLFGVAAMACLVPAWRAARIDPCITLRAE